MKNKLALVTKILDLSNVSSNLETTKQNAENMHSPFIINAINYNFGKTGYISDGTTFDKLFIPLIYYRDYANSWPEFAQRFKTLKFLNFDARAGGQGYTQTKNTYELKTQDFHFNEVHNVLIYENHGYAQQKATIDFTLFERDGMVILCIYYYTRSSNALYHVWASLSMSDVVFS